MACRYVDSFQSVHRLDRVPTYKGHWRQLCIALARFEEVVILADMPEPCGLRCKCCEQIFWEIVAEAFPSSGVAQSLAAAAALPTLQSSDVGTAPSLFSFGVTFLSPAHIHTQSYGRASERMQIPNRGPFPHFPTHPSPRTLSSSLPLKSLTHTAHYDQPLRRQPPRARSAS